MSTIIFVCTGNTCRSPMAEFYFNFSVRGSELEDKFSASSFGIRASAGSPMAHFSKEVINRNFPSKEYILDENYSVSLFKSRQINEQYVKRAVLVYGMTAVHGKYMQEMFPEHRDKIKAMPFDIDDPYAGNIKTYENCFKKIKEAVDIIIKELKAQI